RTRSRSSSRSASRLRTWPPPPWPAGAPRRPGPGPGSSSDGCPVAGSGQESRDEVLWMKMALHVLAAGACAPGLVAAASARPAADLVLTHARIWTVDKARPEAEALAVVGDRIVAIGSAAEIEAWRGPATKVIDAGGKRVLPGFNDAHVHFEETSAQLSNVQLKDARSPEELARRVAAHAKTLPKDEWVMGGQWDDQAFSPPRLPTKESLDAVVAD